MKHIFLLLLVTLIAASKLAAQNSSGDPHKDSLLLAGERKVYVMYDIHRPPNFPGGDQELNNFLRAHFKYYNKSTRRMKPSTLVVNFVVEKDGSISNVKLLRGEAFLLPALKETIGEMPLWEPGLFHTDPVAVLYTLPIRVEY